jgi:hypothetical protein
MGRSSWWEAPLNPKTLAWLEGLKADLPEAAATKVAALSAKIREKTGLSTSQPADEKPVGELGKQLGAGNP